jgi:hypothetical protein
MYPERSDPLIPGDLQQLFSPSFDERKLAPTIARTAEFQLALLVQLKIFQTIGRFRHAPPNLAAEGRTPSPSLAARLAFDAGATDATMQALIPSTLAVADHGCEFDPCLARFRWFWNQFAGRCKF